MSIILLKHPPNFYIVGKSASACVDATNVASLGTTYDVTCWMAVFQSVMVS